MRKNFIVLLLMVAAVLVLASCSGGESPAADCPDCPECPEIDCPAPLGGEVPFEAAWASSGHADSDAEAFRHWDEEDDGLVAAKLC